MATVIPLAVGQGRVPCSERSAQHAARRAEAPAQAGRKTNRDNPHGGSGRSIDRSNLNFPRNYHEHFTSLILVDSRAGLADRARFHRGAKRPDPAASSSVRHSHRKFKTHGSQTVWSAR